MRSRMSGRAVAMASCADAAARAVAVAQRREHDEAQRDDAVDGGEGDDGEAEPRLGLHIAVDVAGHRAASAASAASGFRRRFCRAAVIGSPCAGTLPVVSGGTGAEHGADRIAGSAAPTCGRAGSRSKLSNCVGSIGRSARWRSARPWMRPGVSSFAHSARSARDGVALAAQFAGELGDALGLQRGIELDLVDEGRRQDERADHEDVEKAHGQRPFNTSASDGSRGSRSDGSSARAGASVRSAARSLAERARGLRAISSASATTGRLVSARKVGAGASGSGAWREPARVSPRRREKRFDDAVLERMERHHHQAAAGLQDAFGGGERARPVRRVRH